jgi:peroxiredoxin
MDSVADAREMARLTGAAFPILADPNRQAIGPYGVYNLLGDGVAAPATFIIGADGVLRWFHVGKDVGDRPTPHDILQRLRDLGIG